MYRVLVLGNAWETPHEGLPPLAGTLATHTDLVVVASTGEDPPAAPGQAVSGLVLPLEPARSSGFLFALRNALFFGTAANPGNYALLRDRLHMHLQEVLYDAVVILCPPEVYLRIGNWIHETFGIPVWLHLSAAPTPGHGWIYRRLRRKYLAAAKLITADSGSFLQGIGRHEDQAALVAAGPADNLTFTDPATGAAYSAESLLQRIIRKKQHS